MAAPLHDRAGSGQPIPPKPYARSAEPHSSWQPPAERSKARSAAEVAVGTPVGGPYFALPTTAGGGGRLPVSKPLAPSAANKLPSKAAAATAALVKQGRGAVEAGRKGPPTSGRPPSPRGALGVENSSSSAQHQQPKPAAPARGPSAGPLKWSR